MQEFQPRDQLRFAPGDVAVVTHFAAQVVSLLVSPSSRNEPAPHEALVIGLIAASLSGTKDAFAELLAEVKRSRISIAALADIYIPEAARRMGVAWHEDEMSWMDVSIGVGRLQSLLREIGSAWAADRGTDDRRQATDGGHGTIMLLLPDREQHTLGPMVAMGQMRRYGVSVCLRIAPSFEELRNLMAARRFVGILTSVSTKERLTSVAKTVQSLKTVMSRPCPIIVGGAVMSKVEDPASCTGVDLSSNYIGAALEAIGLKFDASCVLRRA